MPRSLEPASDRRENVRVELFGLLTRLSDLLRRQRQRGRSRLGDTLRGMLIEDGEAEGLVQQLASRLEARDDEPALPDVPWNQVREPDTDGIESDLSLVRTRFELTPAEYDAVLLALAVEWDSRFGRLVTYLNDNVNQSRPTIGLAGALGADGPFADFAPVAMLDRPVVRDGLLEVDGDGPVPTRSVRLDERVARRLLGDEPESSDRVQCHESARGLLDTLVLAPDCHRDLTSWCARHRSAVHPPTLLIAGGDGMGRATVARACAGEFGLRAVVVSLSKDVSLSAIRAGRREARWHSCALVVRLPELGEADARLVWDATRGTNEPVIFCCSYTTSEALLAGLTTVPTVVRIAPPDFSERSRIWKHLLPRDWRVRDDDVDALSARFRFGPGRISNAIARVKASMVIDPTSDGGTVQTRLTAACSAIGAASMSELAEILPLPYVLTDLVVREELRRELELTVAWMTHRKQVLETWAFKTRLAQAGGLTALFSGPPGTGKTMAAQAVARSLQVMLYRVDLSRVLSKWIGETERNLGRLFDEAQSAGCALFFDEADALFGKRSDVRDARDRYANVEIGYLLQRMDQHDGVTILATNRPGDLDDAFLRRFHVNARFAMPDAEERARIWRAVFPTEAALADDVELSDVARSFDLSGGEIRNAALAAAFLAASDGSLITRRHVIAATVREMRKSGRVVADELLRQI